MSKFPILISYAFAKQNRSLFESWVERDDCDILLDCGAFTAANAGHVITLTEYLAFLDDYKDRLFRYLALDKVKDPKQTAINLQIMLDKGYNPVPVHIFGDGQEKMDELFEISDYVACAGLRRPNRGLAPKSYVQQKMEWARGRNVHWLGYTLTSMLTKFRPYSCDSASHGSGVQYGEAAIYLGYGKWAQSCYKDRIKLLRNDAAMAKVYEMGFTLKDFHDPLCWRGATKHGYTHEQELTAILTTDSHVRYSIDLFNHFKVRYFLAVALCGIREFNSITRAIERHGHLLDMGNAAV